VVVCDARQNVLLKVGDKTDRIDAEALNETVVHVPDGGCNMQKSKGTAALRRRLIQLEERVTPVQEPLVMNVLFIDAITREVESSMVIKFREGVIFPEPSACEPAVVERFMTTAATSAGV
jgi:hypothetical protein